MSPMDVMEWCMGAFMVAWTALGIVVFACAIRAAWRL